jgi:hypothetical protein
MASKKRLNLVAPCGIDCGICELYTCGHDHELFNKLIEMDMPKEKLPCDGCRSVEGACPVIGEICETYKCALEKKVEFCYDCNEFPCERLQPAADRAVILPHNMKIFNLCTIKHMGLDAFVKKSPEIKKRYYTGKMAIGKGPQA